MQRNSYLISLIYFLLFLACMCFEMAHAADKSQETYKKMGKVYESNLKNITIDVDENNYQDYFVGLFELRKNIKLNCHNKNPQLDSFQMFLDLLKKINATEDAHIYHNRFLLSKLLQDQLQDAEICGEKWWDNQHDKKILLQELQKGIANLRHGGKIKIDTKEGRFLDKFGKNLNELQNFLENKNYNEIGKWIREAYRESLTQDKFQKLHNDANITPLKSGGRRVKHVRKDELQQCIDQYPIQNITSLNTTRNYRIVIIHLQYLIYFDLFYFFHFY